MIRAVDVTTEQPEVQSKIEPFLLEVADVVNTTLDLDTTLRRVAELVCKIVDYEIFAILLLNEKTQDLRIRFQVGYPKEVADRMRIKVGDGVTGLAAQRREAILVGDVAKDGRYISAIPEVRSELAVPLIIKNRVIGVIDIESLQPDHFTEEHKQLLTLIASRVAVGIENARLYTRTTRQARTLLLLNEIARELTSILNLDQLLKRIAELLSRLIDYQMFSILLLDASGEKLQHRFSLRFQENIQLKHDVPLGKGIVGHAAQHKHAVLVPDVSKDARYVLSNPETRSELAVPLIYKDKVIGVLDLEHTRRGFFTDDHKRTITTLAAQVAIAIENARLYEQIERQEKRLERDLALARELQFRLLPQAPPHLANLEVAAKFSPARAIGGDLYDFVDYTMAQRLVRAKGKIRHAGIPYSVPDTKDMPGRLDAVLTVIYLVFTEGYAATRGAALVRTDFCAEAIRLARLVRALMGPEPPSEATALLALMLLHDSRREARPDEAGDLVLLEDQDRGRWNHLQIAEALPLVEEALRGGPGPFALQSAVGTLPRAKAARSSGEAGWLTPSSPEPSRFASPGRGATSMTSPRSPRTSRAGRPGLANR